MTTIEKTTGYPDRSQEEGGNWGGRMGASGPTQILRKHREQRETLTKTLTVVSGKGIGKAN